jgi:hypothetical protein
MHVGGAQGWCLEAEVEDSALEDIARRHNMGELAPRAARSSTPITFSSPAHTGSPVWEWRRGMCWARPQGATGSGFRGLVGEDRGGGWLALVPLSWATRRVGPAVNWPLLSLLCAVHAVRCTGALQRYWASTVAGLPCPKSQLPSGSEQPDKTDVLTHVV